MNFYYKPLSQLLLLLLLGLQRGRERDRERAGACQRANQVLLPKNYDNLNLKLSFCLIKKWNHSWLLFKDQKQKKNIKTKRLLKDNCNGKVSLCITKTTITL